MKADLLPDNPYILLTPGPLSTTKTVKAAMLQDWCTWDDEYNALVQDIRARLVRLANGTENHTAILMQGSGTFAVESVLGTAIAREGKLLIIANGHYGMRMGTIADRLCIPYTLLDLGETGKADGHSVAQALDADQSITHVAVVHCETTTGMLNPIEEIGTEVVKRGRTYIVDAMSSFGGIPLSVDEIGCDYLISSANKCIQGVPGFGFVIANRDNLSQCEGNARSLSLDLYDQWTEMEEKDGKWRFTSPTHVVHAFARALDELDTEGGVSARYARYNANHTALIQGMEALGFECLLPEEYQSPIITSFYDPDDLKYDFKVFYSLLKSKGWVIYPGKVTGASTFRIGSIGDVSPEHITQLLTAIQESMHWI